MPLVDTSVWVAHFREQGSPLADVLEAGEVLCHPFVIGELACGNLSNRATILSLLSELPQAAVAEHEEVLTLIDLHKLQGRGLGYIDIHLLSSALITDAPLWTLDRRLAEAAEALGCRYSV